MAKPLTSFVGAGHYVHRSAVVHGVRGRFCCLVWTNAVLTGAGLRSAYEITPTCRRARWVESGKGAISYTVAPPHPGGIKPAEDTHHRGEIGEMSNAHLQLLLDAQSLLFRHVG